MQRKNNIFFERPIIKWGIIPIILFLIWTALTAWFMAAYDSSFLVVSYNHQEKSFIRNSYTPLQKNNIVSGSFTSVENNLGIVAIRFEQFARVPYKDEDLLVFRIKENGANKWYYENFYRSGFIYDLPFMPFGFPLIHDSKGKKYYFELESLKGNRKNAMQVSDRYPNLVSKYQASKESLIANKKLLFMFTVKKLYTYLFNIDIVYSSFIYALPFMLYALLMSRFRKTILFPFIRLKNIFLNYINIFLLIVILIDIFYLQLTNDSIYLVCGALWYKILSLDKQDSKYSFFVGILLLGCSPLFLAFNKIGISLKLSMWAYVFFITGVVQILTTFFEKTKK